MKAQGSAMQNFRFAYKAQGKKEQGYLFAVMIAGVIVSLIVGDQISSLCAGCSTSTHGGK